MSLTEQAHTQTALGSLQLLEMKPTAWVLPPVSAAPGTPRTPDSSFSGLSHPGHCFASPLSSFLLSAHIPAVSSHLPSQHLCSRRSGFLASTGEMLLPVSLLEDQRPLLTKHSVPRTFTSSWMRGQHCGSDDQEGGNEHLFLQLRVISSLFPYAHTFQVQILWGAAIWYGPVGSPVLTWGQGWVWSMLLRALGAVCVSNIFWYS